MGFKINKVKADLNSYPPYMFLAPRKFGKTTWWYKLVKEAWGEDTKGLLISFGNEEGYHSLDGLQVEVAKEWDQPYDEDTDLRGFVQIVDDVIENNNTYGIKGVCFDTLDTMVAVATKEVLRQHKREKGTTCKSLNDAFSGYGRGTERLLSIMDEQIEKLRDAGIAVFILCHIKNKERSDLVSGDKFEMITNNLPDSIYTHFGDAAQIVMVGVLDREINNGKILKEERVVYLRGNSQVDAGGRFEEIREKIDLNPASFLEAFNEAVKASMGNKSATDKDIAKMKEAEEETAKKKAEIALSRRKENEINEEENADLLEKIKSVWNTVSAETKDEAKQYMKSEGYSKFNDEVPTKVLHKVVEMLGV